MKKKPVWRTIYLIVLIVATVVIIARSSALRFSRVSWSGFFPLNLISCVSVSGTTEHVEDAELAAFTAIEFDADMASIEIRYGEKPYVEFDFPSNMKPTYEVKNDTLVISEKNNSFFSGSNYDLKITVPEGTTLNRISGSIDAGDLTVKGVIVKSIEVDLDAGNITLQQVTLETASLEADMGSISVEGTIGELKAVADMGAVSVTTVNDLNECKLTLKTDLGSVSVNGKYVGNEYVQ